VLYGGDFGSDLPAVAAFARASEDEAVRMHTGRTYRVFMLGFVPGFAYMGIVDERIAMPRHATPRVRVPAGSVGIAGEFTGVYPRESPGGWRLLGRTPLRIVDLASGQFPIRAGDRLRFVPIGAEEFAARRGELL